MASDVDRIAEAWAESERRWPPLDMVERLSGREARHRERRMCRQAFMAGVEWAALSPEDVARIKAEAWDEGHMDGYWDAEHEQMIQRGVRRRTDNPYRAAAEAEAKP